MILFRQELGDVLRDARRDDGGVDRDPLPTLRVRRSRVGHPPDRTALPERHRLLVQVAGAQGDTGVLRPAADAAAKEITIVVGLVTRQIGSPSVSDKFPIRSNADGTVALASAIPRLIRLASNETKKKVLFLPL